MIAFRTLVLGLAVMLPAAATADAQGTTPLASVTTEQRAEALLGLGRVARDRGDHGTAHLRFQESDRLRPFDATRQDEHFWIAVHADRTAAFALARRLTEGGTASRAVCERWVALASTSTLDESRQAIELAERRHPDSRWASAWAALALRAEGVGNIATASQAWAKVPAPIQESRDDWHASSLRVAVAGQSRAALAPALDAYVQQHGDNVGMRRLAVEAWADAGQPARALDRLEPLLAARPATADVRRAADLSLAAGDLNKARRFFERLASPTTASVDDVKALAGVLASQRDGAALRRLFTNRASAPCAADRVTALMAAGDEELLADLMPSLSSSCPVYPEVARRVAATWLARDRAGVAETWLAAVAPGDMTDAHRVLLAQALSARGAWREVDAVLGAVTAADGTAVAADAAALRVWAWAGQGRAAEAWALAQRTQTPASATAAGQAGWAALAFTAGDLTSAESLARTAIGSTRDVDARAVLASLAAVEGRPAETRRWLAPVASSLRQPGHVRLWLDAAEAIGGARLAIAEAGAYASIVAGDVDLLARQARWSAETGDMTAARRDASRVRALSADRATYLDIVILLASGDAVAAWDALSRPVTAANAAVTKAEWQRLTLDAAVAAERWSEARDALATLGDELTPAERTLATGRIALGADGRLSTSLRADLEALVARDAFAAPARIVLAGADVADGEPARALARLGVQTGDDTLRRERNDLRSVLAQALLGLERPADVLTVVADAAAEPSSLRVLRARALVRLGRIDEARRGLETLARSSRGVDAYLAWAETAADAQARVAILRQALEAHPARVDVGERYVQGLADAGDLAAASTQAARLLTQSPSSRVAWQVQVRVATTADDATLVTRLHEAWEALSGDAERAFVIGEGLAHASRVPAPALALADGWLIERGDDARAARLRARLAVSAGSWTVAEQALASLQRVAPDEPGTQRLAAQVAAWSGRHGNAVPLYLAYLDRRPDDADAWREYARLLTWRGDAPGASDAYARLMTLTTAPAVSAEAETKRALSRHDWPAAAQAATRWGALEPSSLDAAVDLAQALDQAGRALAADLAWADVARRPGLPDVVQRSIDARRTRNTATVVGRYDVVSTDAFGGQRLVETRLAGVAGEMPVRPGGALWVTGQVDQGQVHTAAATRDLQQGDLGVRGVFGAGVRGVARIGAVRVGDDDQMRAQAQVFAPVTRRLGVAVDVARLPFWENGATVAAGLQATTAGVGVRLLAAGDVDASFNLSQGAISDGNTRRQVDATVGRQFGGGRQAMEVRASGFLFGFDRSTSAYFSPDSLGRVDLEVGMTRWLGQGGTIRDGRHVVRARTGFGVDSEGRAYVLGSAGVVVPLGGTVGLGLDGRWTSSRVYRAWQFTAGLQVGLGRGTTNAAASAASERP
ncbi:MAG TPA: hypothetical protein VMF13_20930 [Luteitalea sp.]|nr:hypothetical protein [Luteitalea sp.]